MCDQRGRCDAGRPPRPAGAAAAVHLATTSMLAALVRRLSPRFADSLRRRSAAPGELPRPVRAIRGVLRRGGVPPAVRSFVLADNTALRFTNVDSLVTQQLYWFGEQGWEPELLPWWKHLCRRAHSIVELGANIGYFTVQGSMVAPHARYVGVEGHPVAERGCREKV